jgi:hypothetical protein
VKEDDKILKGFIWKPKERPANKQAVINPAKVVPPAKVTRPVKPPTKAGIKDTSKIGSPALKVPEQAKKDSTLKGTPVGIKPANLPKPNAVKVDTTKKAPAMKEDTVVKKP